MTRLPRRDAKGHFLPGNPGGPGRTRGSKNRRQLVGAALLTLLHTGDDRLPGAEQRWRRLLVERDARVRLDAEKFLWECAYGKAPQRPSVDGKPWDAMSEKERAEAMPDVFGAWETPSPDQPAAAEPHEKEGATT